MSTIGGSGESILTPKERVGRALDDLTQVARPIVTSELRRAYGDEWFRRAQEGPLARSPWARQDNVDAYIVLALLSWAWEDIFAAILPTRARRLVSQVSEARNSWAHEGTFSPSEADDIIRAVAELIALFPGQGYVPSTAPLWSAAPPPAPFRLPGRRAVTTATMAPARRQPRARPGGRRWPRGCFVALVLLLVPTTLCGLGSLAIAVFGGGRPAVARTATTTLSASVTPSPVAAKPTPTVAGVARYTVAATGGIGVYLRVAPDSAERLRAYPEGTLLESIGAAPISTGSGRWRHVRAPDGTEGWVLEKYLAPTP